MKKNDILRALLLMFIIIGVTVGSAFLLNIPTSKVIEHREAEKVKAYLVYFEGAEGLKDITEDYPITEGQYAREDGVLRPDARAKCISYIPLSEYKEFYVTAEGKWSCTLMTLFDSAGTFVWGTDSAYNGGPTAWSEEHIVVSELLADHPTACYVTFSAIDSDASNTVLTVLARPK